MEITKTKVVVIGIIVFIVAIIALVVSFKDSIFGSKSQKTDFTLQIIHFNDFHARFEELSPKSSTCKPNMTNCIGGFSRLYTAIKSLKEAIPNSLVLSAGDNFQGTIWYNIYKWNVTQHFLNFLPLDAVTLGNHEFDDGIAGVVPYIKALKFPVIVSNINDTFEPTFNNIYRKSVTVMRSGRKIGIIGVITESTQIIAKSEKLIFLNEADSVRREAEVLKLKEKCDIIIVVSHCGTEGDRKIALGAGEYVDVIVGGHSHSLYYHGENSPGLQPPEEDYPYIIKLPDGKKVFIVQAACYTKFVGHLILNFNANNEVLTWEGNTIYLDTNLPQDKRINEELLTWKLSVETEANVVIGSTQNEIDRTNCTSTECLGGNFITKTMIYAWDNYLFNNNNTHLTHGPIALMHQGGIRANIGRGDITYQDLLQVIPFDCAIVSVKMKGEHIFEVLEYAVNSSAEYKNYNSRNFVQVDGLRFVINQKKSYGSRIQNLTVSCKTCPTLDNNPVYVPLNKTTLYQILLPNFLADGGDGFNMFNKYAEDKVTGPQDIYIATKFVKENSPITIKIDGRIQVVK